MAMCLGYGAGMRLSEISGLKEFKSKCCKADVIFGKDEDKPNRKLTTCKVCGKKLHNQKDMFRDINGGWHIKPLSKEHIEQNYIRVIGGKGGKDRQVPLPIKLFRKAGITRGELKKNLPLFVSRRSVQDYPVILGAKVLKKKNSFHVLRHGFATYCLESGMDLEQVRMLLGHARLDTTQRYLHANPTKALEQYEDIEW